MYIANTVIIVIMTYAVGEAALRSYYSSQPIDENAAYETSVFSISSIFMCSHKCLEHQCYHVEFDDVENSCTIAGKVISVPPSSGHIIQETFSRCNKEVNIVQPSFQTASSSVYASVNEPGKGSDLDFETMFHSQTEVQPWWSIDLETSHFVSKIRVTVRSGWTSRFGDISIYLSNVPETDPAKFKDLPFFAAVVGNLPSPSWTIPCSVGSLQGRYLYVQMDKTDLIEFFEIEIHGC